MQKTPKEPVPEDSSQALCQKQQKNTQKFFLATWEPPAEDAAFHTLNGYRSLQPQQSMTASMEDYLEMICRLCGAHPEKENRIRIGHLAEMLHVKPPSASKMVGNLKNAGLVTFEKYGHIALTAQGRAYGDYLLRRHNVLQSFFCCLNRTEDELELVEQIEHFINPRTVRSMEMFLQCHGKSIKESGECEKNGFE